MIDKDIEIEISFYCDSIICKGHYHDFANSYESNEINLEHMDIRTNKKKNNE